jgi:hypothetical protein
MKLYKRTSRLRFLRHVPRAIHDRLRWALKLKPGDLINDCSMFNVVIREVQPCIVYTKRGWYIYDVDFTTEPFGGGCSLMHCGVEPPLSPEKIEQRLRSFYDNWNRPESDGWEFKTEKDKVWANLSQGLPICDERGVKVL